MQSLSETIREREETISQLRAEIAELREDFGRGYAYWTAIKERDDARRLCCEDRAQRSGEYREEVAHSLGWRDLYCECCGKADDLRTVGDCGGGVIVWCKSCRTKHGKDQQNELNNSETQNRRTRRSDFITEQKSDSDPVTGVQYGDLV